ncbi:MAG: lipoprotein [Burkholderiaceae bacterium]
MLRIRQILVSVLVLAVSAAELAGCGQKGPLVLPTEPAAAQRATLPQTLRQGAIISPATGASAALPTP